MGEPVTDALRRLVASCESPEELNWRVVQSFGESMLGSARQIAAETKGFEWLRQGRVVQEHVHKTDERISAYRVGFYASRIARSPGNLVLGIGSLALIAVVLFPPFIVHLPEGLLSHAGYGFLFSPPQIGRLVAVVNVPLLAIEAAVVCAITAAVFLVVRSVAGARDGA